MVQSQAYYFETVQTSSVSELFNIIDK